MVLSAWVPTQATGDRVNEYALVHAVRPWLAALLEARSWAEWAAQLEPPHHTQPGTARTQGRAHMLAAVEVVRVTTHHCEHQKCL